MVVAEDSRLFLVAIHDGHGWSGSLSTRCSLYAEAWALGSMDAIYPAGKKIRNHPRRCVMEAFPSTLSKASGRGKKLPIYTEGLTLARGTSFIFFFFDRM